MCNTPRCVPAATPTHYTTPPFTHCRRWRPATPSCCTRTPATASPTSRTWAPSSAPTSARVSGRCGCGCGQLSGVRCQAVAAEAQYSIFQLAHTPFCTPEPHWVCPLAGLRPVNPPLTFVAPPPRLGRDCGVHLPRRDRRVQPGLHRAAALCARAQPQRARGPQAGGLPGRGAAVSKLRFEGFRVRVGEARRVRMVL